MLLPHNRDHQDKTPRAKRHKVHTTEEILAWMGVGHLGANTLFFTLEKKLLQLFSNHFGGLNSSFPKVLQGRGQ